MGNLEHIHHGENMDPTHLSEPGNVLQDYDRLIGKGLPPRRAAALLGASASGIRALSATVQQEA